MELGNWASSQASGIASSDSFVIIRGTSHQGQCRAEVDRGACCNARCCFDVLQSVHELFFLRVSRLRTAQLLHGSKAAHKSSQEVMPENIADVSAMRMLQRVCKVQIHPL
jgi:hypothetical protein